MQYMENVFLGHFRHNFGGQSLCVFGIAALKGMLTVVSIMPRGTGDS